MYFGSVAMKSPLDCYLVVGFQCYLFVKVAVGMKRLNEDMTYHSIIVSIRTTECGIKLHHKPHTFALQHSGKSCCSRTVGLLSSFSDS